MRGGRRHARRRCQRRRDWRELSWWSIRAGQCRRSGRRNESLRRSHARRHNRWMRWISGNWRWGTPCLRDRRRCSRPGNRRTDRRRDRSPCRGRRWGANRRCARRRIARGSCQRRWRCNLRRRRRLSCAHCVTTFSTECGACGHGTTAGNAEHSGTSSRKVLAAYKTHNREHKKNSPIHNRSRAHS